MAGLQRLHGARGRGRLSLGLCPQFQYYLSPHPIARQIIVGCAMGEVCSTYPSAGSVYHVRRGLPRLLRRSELRSHGAVVAGLARPPPSQWTGQLAPVKWAPLFSFVCGWFNFVGACRRLGARTRTPCPPPSPLVPHPPPHPTHPRPQATRRETPASRTGSRRLSRRRARSRPARLTSAGCTTSRRCPATG